MGTICILLGLIIFLGSLFLGFAGAGVFMNSAFAQTFDSLRQRRADLYPVCGRMRLHRTADLPELCYAGAYLQQSAQTRPPQIIQKQPSSKAAPYAEMAEWQTQRT